MNRPGTFGVGVGFAIALSTVAAAAAEIVYNREATAAEIAAVRQAAPEIMQQAEAMPPVSAWAADGDDGKVVVRIEAGAVCGSMIGCPAYVLADSKVRWRGMLPERADWPSSTP